MNPIPPPSAPPRLVILHPRRPDGVAGGGGSATAGPGALASDIALEERKRVVAMLPTFPAVGLDTTASLAPMVVSQTFGGSNALVSGDKNAAVGSDASTTGPNANLTTAGSSTSKASTKKRPKRRRNSKKTAVDVAVTNAGTAAVCKGIFAGVRVYFSGTFSFHTPFLMHLPNPTTFMFHTNDFCPSSRFDWLIQATPVSTRGATLCPCFTPMADSLRHIWPSEKSPTWYIFFCLQNG